MPTYLIANLGVRNVDQYDADRRQVLVSIGKFDGRYLARGEKLESLEGNLARQAARDREVSVKVSRDHGVGIRRPRSTERRFLRRRGSRSC